MKSLNTLRLVPGLLGFAIALAPIAMNAEIRSSSKEIVVMEPRPARTGPTSRQLFLSAFR